MKKDEVLAYIKVTSVFMPSEITIRIEVSVGESRVFKN